MDPIFICVVLMAAITAIVLFISYIAAKIISKHPIIYSILYIILFLFLIYWYSAQYNSLVRTVIIQKIPVENINMNFNNSSVIDDIRLDISRYRSIQAKNDPTLKTCFKKDERNLEKEVIYRDICLVRNEFNYSLFYVNSDEMNQYLDGDAIIKDPYTKFYNFFLVVLMSFGFSYFLSNFIAYIYYNFQFFKSKSEKFYFYSNFAFLFGFILSNAIVVIEYSDSVSDFFDKYPDVYPIISGGIIMIVMKKIYDSALFLSSDKKLITELGKLEENYKKIIKIKKQIDYIEYWNFKNPQNKLNEHIALYRKKKKIKSKIEDGKLFIRKCTKNIGFEIDCNTLTATKEIILKLNKILKNNNNDN